LSDRPVQPLPTKRLVRWSAGILAIVGLLAIGFLLALWLLLGIGKSDPGRQRTLAGQQKDRLFSVGQVSHLRGTNLLMVEILASEGSPSSYKGSRRDVRNILLVDQATGSNRKLLPDNSRSIETSAFFPAVATNSSWRFSDISTDELGTEDAAPVAYFLLSIRQAKGRKFDLLVGTIAGRHQGYVMRGIDGVERIWLQTPGAIGLIVRDDLGLYHRIVDVPTLKVVASRLIPID
jgi:hypothetical protein